MGIYGNLGFLAGMRYPRLSPYFLDTPISMMKVPTFQDDLKSGKLRVPIIPTEPKKEQIYKEKREAMLDHINNQFDLSGDIEKTGVRLGEVIATSELPSLDSLHDKSNRLSSPKLVYDLLESKGVQLNIYQKVWGKYYSDERYDWEGAEGMIGNEILKLNIGLEGDQPLIIYRGIFDDKKKEDELETITEIINFEPTPRAAFTYQLEKALVPQTTEMKNTWMVDLPMYNYALRIEEVCIDEFEPEFCDRAVTELHVAYQKLGPILNRSYKIINEITAKIIGTGYPELYELLMKDNKLFKFGDYSQRMLYRVEYLTTSYVWN